jgi:hypothetical protein
MASFADAVADRIAELSADFAPGRRRYRVIVEATPHEHGQALPR